MDTATNCLHNGGLLLFPTETFFALGSLASISTAVRSVYQVKSRPTSSPLPLVAANLEQVASICNLHGIPESLLDFWPGPLTLLAPAHTEAPLVPILVGKNKLVAIRISSHPLVQEICRNTGFPLTASSANISGQPPARSFEQLDGKLLEQLKGHSPLNGYILPRTIGEEPAGGLPSTIVHVLHDGRLAIHRQGAITTQVLQARGFACVEM